MSISMYNWMIENVFAQMLKMGNPIWGDFYYLHYMFVTFMNLQ